MSEVASPPTNTLLIEAAERIRLRLQKTGEDVVAIGHDLIAVRQALGPERFGDWIREEFDMSRTSAYRFIQVAERFPSPIVGLSATALYELVAPDTPEEVVQEVTERAERGEPPSASEVRQLREQVREAEQETETPAPPHKLKSSPPRPSESHSSHDAEVMALLTAWDAARQSARNAFLTIIHDSREAADLSDADGHLHSEQPAPESNAEGADQLDGAGAPEREGDRRGDRAGGETPGASSSGQGSGSPPKGGNGRAAESGSRLEDWPDIPASLRRVA